jgi:hypothetical protein
MTKATSAAIGAHLVGGIKAESAEEAMRTVGGTLGKHIYAITDGETGPRKGWVLWQMDKLAAIDGITMGGIEETQGGRQTVQIPKLVVDGSLTELPGRALGYADAALASYEIFVRLRNEGVIPAGVKFQVSLPTPLVAVVSFVDEKQQDRFYPIYAAAMAAEAADIIKAIPADDLMLQFDVAGEIALLCGAFPAPPGELGDKDFILGELRKLLALAPKGVEHGVHLCYGDFGHTHFAVPQDLSLLVELANGIGDAADFIHMPVDRETGVNPSYHKPLRDLAFKGRLALGVVDYHGDEERTRQLVAAAAGGAGREFAVATECGMARIDQGSAPATSLQRLLDLHAAIAQPIR